MNKLGNPEIFSSKAHSFPSVSPTHTCSNHNKPYKLLMTDIEEKEKNVEVHDQDSNKALKVSP